MFKSVERRYHKVDMWRTLNVGDVVLIGRRDGVVAFKVKILNFSTYRKFVRVEVVDSGVVEWLDADDWVVLEKY